MKWANILIGVILRKDNALHGGIRGDMGGYAYMNDEAQHIAEFARILSAESRGDPWCVIIWSPIDGISYAGITDGYDEVCDFLRSNSEDASCCIIEAAFAALNGPRFEIAKPINFTERN